MISPRIYESWLVYCPIAVRDIVAKLKGIPFDPTQDIPEEQFRELPDGTGEIFININKIDKEIKMKVPKGEWAFVSSN